MNLFIKIVIPALFLSFVVCAQSSGSPKATSKEYELGNKRLRGELLTPDEEKILKEIVTKRTEPYAKDHPARESIGLIPLTDLGNGTYQGQQGGLFPGGANVPPPGHLQAGLKAARKVVPRDADGRESKDGKIVLLSIGMSNASAEFQLFVRHRAKEPGLNPRLLTIDGALGGPTSLLRSFSGGTPEHPKLSPQQEASYFKTVDERLSAAGVTPKQVQVVWMKYAYGQPTRPFPAEPKKLQGLLVQVLQTLKQRFPNLEIAYLSSRSYGGYVRVSTSPEPHAYETGFAVKWLIADQIAGSPELNYDAAKGPVLSPWVTWGPYLWADGVKGRKDGLVYLRDDYVEDGTHPSMSGGEKITKLLMDFLKTDPTARPWFVAH
jgi:hypothetical protein